MSSLVRIAFRNIFRQKRRTVLLASAIAFGMLVITLVNSFTAGMADSIQENLIYALGGHIFISGQEITPGGQVISRLNDAEELQQFLAEQEGRIASLTRRSQALATVIFGSRQSMQMVEGVDFAAEDQVFAGLTAVSGDMEAICDQPNGLLLPASLGERLGVAVGETVLLRLDTVTGQQNVGEFLVTAFIEEQSQLGFSAAYAHLEYLNELLDLDASSFQSLNLILHRMDDIDRVAAAFADELPMREESRETRGGPPGMPGMAGMDSEAPTPWEGIRYRVMTLNDIMEPIEALVLLLDTLALGLFAILLLIIIVGITNTFRMILLERTKEIGTMRALGMQRPAVKQIFIFEAMFIGLFGGLLGVVLSLAAMAVLTRIPIANPGLQFFLDQGRFIFRLRPGLMAGYLVLLLLICFAAAYWPARTAARLAPVKALTGRL